MRQTAAILVLALLVGVAAESTYADATSGHQPNRVAFLARADNPVDALAASSVAAQFGGVVLLTPSDRLGGEARDGLAGYRPDLVILAGGTAALSPAVEEQTQEAGYETRRIAGVGRTDTAQQTAALLNEYRTHLRAMLSGAIFMYPAQQECPDGMSRYAALDGAFPRGGTTTQTGGTTSHDHTITGTTDLGEHRDFGNDAFDPRYDVADNSEYGTFHRHTLEADSTHAEHVPPYVNVRYCQM